MKLTILLLLSVVGTISVAAQNSEQDSLAVSIHQQDSLTISNKERVETTSQDSRENHFRLVYIDHEEETPVSVLHQRLEKLHDDAIESGSYLIIYLADENQPIISFTNLSDPEPGRQRNNEEAFYNLIKQMYRTNHEVRASADLDSLKWLLGTDGMFPLFDEKETRPQLTFKSVALDFYIGSRFWNLRCNEDLLAQLFVSLKISDRLNTSDFPPTKLSFNVLKPRGVQLLFPSGMPFGRKNLGGINEKIEIKEY